jgi:hypothetical protein
VLTLAAFGLFAPAAPAAPVTYHVNNNADLSDLDAPGGPFDGTCDVSVAAGEQCTLRAAIQEANQGTDADTIDFTQLTTPATITRAAQPESITGDLTITGPGADNLTIDGANAYQVLKSTASNLTISGLTIQHGLAPVGAFGAGAGGLSAQNNVTLDGVVVTDNKAAKTGAPNGSAVEAGGIGAGNGTLTIRRSTIKNNHAQVSGTGAVNLYANGGGIVFRSGTLTVEQSTINGNDATATVTNPADDGQTLATGGGIYMELADVTIDRSTVSGNTASASGSTRAGSDLNTAKGGGYNEGSQQQTFVAKGSTFSGNVVVGDTDQRFGANLAINAFRSLVPPGSATIEDSILTNPVGADNCSGADQPYADSGGFNIEYQSPAPPFSFMRCFGSNPQSTDLIGTDPKLDTTGLGSHGGPTQTIALLPRSPAIDKGKNFSAPPDPNPDTDQRDVGFPRIVDFPSIAAPAGGDNSDIGAFEARDTTRPSTPSLSLSINHSTGRVKARFGGTDSFGVAYFKCRFDGRPYRTCRSPKVKMLSGGTHKFRVYAVDVAGNPSPVKKKRFSV